MAIYGLRRRLVLSELIRKQAPQRLSILVGDLKRSTIGCTTPSCLLRGRVYFPSRRGLLFFDPERIGFSEESLVPLVTSVEGMIPNSSVPGGYNRFIPLREVEENLVLEHDEAVLTFHYSALFYPQPASIEYQTRLIGYEDAWSPTSTLSSVSFPLLAPGNYEFQVRARIVGQDWGQPSEAVAVQVLSPYYFRWWFVLSAVLVSALLVYVIIQVQGREGKRTAFGVRGYRVSKNT